MTEPAKIPTPPYVGFETFKNSIRNLGKAGELPDQIDNTLFQSMGGSSRAQLMQAMKFFHLIDDKGIPSKALRDLAASDDAQWKTQMKALITTHYGQQVKAMESGTVGSFKESFGSIGGIVTPAARFLLAAANDAGMKVSSHIKKIPVGDRPKKKIDASGAPVAKPDGSPPRDEVLSDDPLVNALIKKFPDFDPNWEEPQQTRWFAAYEKLLAMRKGGAES